MWMYPGSSCPDRSFSADVEIDTWIRRTLALRAHRNSGPILIPSREGVVSPWVNLLKLILT
jgi:hypothetical protein